MTIDVGSSPSGASRAGASGKTSWINDPKVRSYIFQGLLVALFAFFAVEFVLNARENLAARNVSSGFGFLDRPSGFGINQTLIDYSETSSYGRVFVVGVLNTLMVAAVGIVLATIIGFVMGVARLSTNYVISKIATVYVEVMRNLPALFHIIFWYVGVLSVLPSARQSYAIGNTFFLNVRGLYVPRIVWGEGSGMVAAVIGIAIILALAIASWARRRQMQTGQTFPSGLVGLALVIGLPVIAYFVAGQPLSLDYPQLRGFNFTGGVRLIPEFVALTVALAIYTGAFIAEIVRAGILAVSHGQTEAAYSLGLKPGPTLRLVVIPQALRVIIPPLTSQYLNLTKNSSLAVAVGYPDLVSVFAGTTLNQTGQAIEIIAITMLCYLVISLITSAFMNWYNQRIALVER